MNNLFYSIIVQIYNEPKNFFINLCFVLQNLKLVLGHMPLAYLDYLSLKPPIPHNDGVLHSQMFDYALITTTGILYIYYIIYN